jgi:hypothetical protein
MPAASCCDGVAMIKAAKAANMGDSVETAHFRLEMLRRMLLASRQRGNERYRYTPEILYQSWGSAVLNLAICTALSI